MASKPPSINPATAFEVATTRGDDIAQTKPPPAKPKKHVRFADEVSGGSGAGSEISEGEREWEERPRLTREQIREARRERLGNMKLAIDASERSAAEVRLRAGHAGVPVVEGPPMEELGAAMGRVATGIVAVCDATAAADVQWQLEGSARLREGPTSPAPRRAKGTPPVESGGSGV